MADPVKCKKCKGKPARKNQPPCSACNGSGHVIVTTNKDGRAIITPAVRP